MVILAAVAFIIAALAAYLGFYMLRDGYRTRDLTAAILCSSFEAVVVAWMVYLGVTLLCL